MHGSLLEKLMIARTEPKLAEHGADLPHPKRFVARLLLAPRQLTGSRRSFDKCFRVEQKLIAVLVRSFDTQSGACRVLIRRLPGLENSNSTAKPNLFSNTCGKPQS